MIKPFIVGCKFGGKAWCAFVFWDKWHVVRITNTRKVQCQSGEGGSWGTRWPSIRHMYHLTGHCPTPPRSSHSYSAAGTMHLLRSHSYISTGKCLWPQGFPHLRTASPWDNYDHTLTDTGKQSSISLLSSHKLWQLEQALPHY
jgi:hypothetical protein